MPSPPFIVSVARRAYRVSLPGARLEGVLDRPSCPRSRRCPSPSGRSPWPARVWSFSPAWPSSRPPTPIVISRSCGAVAQVERVEAGVARELVRPQRIAQQAVVAVRPVQVVVARPVVERVVPVVALQLVVTLPAAELVGPVAGTRRAPAVVPPEHVGALAALEVVVALGPEQVVVAGPALSSVSSPVSPNSSSSPLSPWIAVVARLVAESRRHREDRAVALDVVVARVRRSARRCGRAR